jgi:hypothetical protein
MRLIDADILKAKVRAQKWKRDPTIMLALDWIYMLIDNSPTIDAEPVVYGEWKTNSNYPEKLICSICGYKEDMWWTDIGTNYCPNCGAKMEDKPCG